MNLRYSNSSNIQNERSGSDVYYPGYRNYQNGPKPGDFYPRKSDEPVKAEQEC